MSAGLKEAKVKPVGLENELQIAWRGYLISLREKEKGRESENIL